jgi:TolB protein
MDAFHPNWSPHDHQIAYESNKGLRKDVWTIPTNGGQPVPVISDSHENSNPVWSPDGRYLYFASNRGGSMNLWRVPVEESSGKVLGPPEPVPTPSPSSAQLTISRDGRRIAYVQSISTQNLYQIAFDPVAEKAVGQPVAITRGSNRYCHPNLSPDGQWLTFGSYGEPADIFVVRTDGTGLRQLTEDAYRDFFPRWSPDGKRIAFQSARSGRSEIWLINPDGSGLEQLTYTFGEWLAGPVWSPDGTRILYNRGAASPCVIEVGKPWKEQSPEALPPMHDPNAMFRARSWSPDGRRLAGFQEGATRNIIIYSFESQQYDTLTDIIGDPIWLSDSRRLLVAPASFKLKGKIFLLDSQSKKVREVLSVAPQEVDGRMTRSRDDRLIYFGLKAAEADIWLMTLE